MFRLPLPPEEQWRPYYAIVGLPSREQAPTSWARTRKYVRQLWSMVQARDATIKAKDAVIAKLKNLIPAAA